MLYPDFSELVGLRNRASRLAISSKRKVSDTMMGDQESPFRGQGLEFEEVRAYSPGDDIRSIDWRVTARTGTTHTKVFKEERERSVILCVDVNAYMRFGTRANFKSVQAARVAALLGWQANANRNKLGACLYGDVPDGTQFFKPKTSRKSLWEMFKRLSNQNILEQEQQIPLEETLQHLNQAVSTGALIYIISDFNSPSDALEKQFSNLRKRCDLVLIAINDPADKMIPPVGTLLFSKNSDDKLRVNTDDKKARADYQNTWQENRKNLKQLTVRNGIDLIELYTDSNLPDDLILGLKRISRGRHRK